MIKDKNLVLTMWRIQVISCFKHNVLPWHSISMSLLTKLPNATHYSRYQSGYTAVSPFAFTQLFQPYKTIIGALVFNLITGGFLFYQR
jgi:hypothetical protein